MACNTLKESDPIANTAVIELMLESYVDTTLLINIKPELLNVFCNTKEFILTAIMLKFGFSFKDIKAN